VTVGTQPGTGQVNTQLTALALALRNDCQSVINLFEFVNAAGGGEGLDAGFTALGFASGDATTASTLLSYMNTIAGVYAGTATQGSEFNFANALAVLWAAA
jgi:hypothetical protein